ncbi:MAG TPA: MFS transporter [Candidatus Limnocylindrales bacterium]
MAMPVLVNASKEYSRLRLISSAGAGAGAIVFGVLYAFAGYSAAPLVFAGIMVFTIACAQFVPLGRDRECRRRASAKREGRTHAAPGQGRFGSIGEAFKIRPRLAAVLVSMVFVFIGIMASGTYISLRISDLGGGAVEIGMANGIGSAAEIPGLILAGFLVASFRCPAGFLVARFGARPGSRGFIGRVRSLPAQLGLPRRCGADSD